MKMANYYWNPFYAVKKNVIFLQANVNTTCFFTISILPLQSSSWFDIPDAHDVCIYKSRTNQVPIAFFSR